MHHGPSLIEAMKSGFGNLAPQILDENPRQLDEIADHWNGLCYLGLKFEFGTHSLLCSHRKSGFSFSIPYDQAASEELHRQLFTTLRRNFGGFTDRHLGALFQPSHQITTMFDGFRGLLPLCSRIAAARS